MSAIIHAGDCLDVMAGMADASVDLIVTSPPYAQQRKATYGGVRADQYVDWFLPIAAQMRRVLSPSGSFVLNIKEDCKGGERATYVIELILALRSNEWRWIDEYVWHKALVVPGKWPNRLKDAWERCLHFSPSLRPAMYHEAVKVPARTTEARRCKERVQGKVNQSSSTHQGYAKTDAKMNPDMVLPSNVLAFSTEQKANGHPAPFPEALPTWFIRLFTLPGDTVLDPFAGSGTTGIACVNTGRHFIGIEQSAEYCDIARRRIAAAAQPALFAAD